MFVICSAVCGGEQGIMKGEEEVRSGTHLRELDGVRGAAVLMVVLLHAMFGIMSEGFIPARVQPILNAFFGGAGVDLFFVLSGFLIGGILIDNKGASNYFRVFWIRRAARILPVYLLLMATYLVAKHIGSSAKAPWFHAFLMQDPLPIWAYLTFTQNYAMAAANSGAARWVGITWSLAVEEQFYLIFPFIVFFLSKRAVIRIAVCCIVVAPLIRSYLWANYGFYPGYFPTPARVDGLMFGVIAAYAVRSPKLKWIEGERLYLDVAAVAATAVLIWGGSLIGSTASYSLRSAIFCYAIIRIFVSDDGFRAFLRTKFMVFMGLISYPFYMYHQAINGLFHGWFLGQVPRIENWTGVAVGVAVLLTAGALATASTKYFEMPIRNFGKRFRYRPADRKNPAPGALGPDGLGVRAS
jgi:peptidoglycan/LPS O-acetylase OafA/YrhL